MTCEMVGLHEIAAMGGFGYKNAKRLRAEGKLPDPHQVLAMGPIWRRQQIEEFLAVPRPGGRPKRMEAAGG